MNPRSLLTALALSLSVGCSAAGDGRDFPEFCGMAFAAPESALEGAREAARRWSVATGCAFTVADTGVPITLVSQVYMFGERKAAVTAMRDGVPEYIELTERYAAARWSTPILMHEMAHAFGIRDHFPDGVGREKVTEHDVITEDLLAAVCERLSCTAFQPE
jgi:hypothetical protein